MIYNPVKLHFGKDVVQGLGKAAAAAGKKALLVYGKGSVKKNGSYQDTLGSLKAAGIEVIEFDGIRPNPVVEDADAAAEEGRRQGADMVVGLGGGSAIDTAKFVAAGIPAGHSVWEFAAGRQKPLKALPLMAVLTLAATGTEMNSFAVIQNNATKKKLGYGHPLMFPRHSFLDPSYTLTVPPDHTAYGIADLVAHSLEAWFGEGEASLTDRFITSIIREAMQYGPRLMNDPKNYELRARIMFAATSALNGLTVQGKKGQDWGVHDIGHALSVLWDIPHGASLSVAYPAWLKLQQERIPERIRELGEALFRNNHTGDTIYKLESFFRLLGSPVSLEEAGINTSDDLALGELLEVMRDNKVSGVVHKLTEDDHRQLIGYMAGNEP